MLENPKEDHMLIIIFHIIIFYNFSFHILSSIRVIFKYNFQGKDICYSYGYF